MILTHKLKVKPLSANKMFNRRGKMTFKSKDYVDFQEGIREELMTDDWTWPFGKDQVSFTIDAGLSNRGADIDNVIKPLLDTYQGMYEGFNDNRVYHLEMNKHIVKKGEEYINVVIKKVDNEE